MSSAAITKELGRLRLSFHDTTRKNLRSLSFPFGIIFCNCLWFLLSAFTVHAQTTQKDLLAQKWKYIGIEEFSVLHAPDSTMKNDWLQLKPDGSYIWMKAGKNISGTWKLNEVAKTIVFTDSNTKKSLSYNLKNITADELTIEYQTPDLVRTKYRFQSAK